MEFHERRANFSFKPSPPEIMDNIHSYKSFRVIGSNESGRLKERFTLGREVIVSAKSSRIM